MSRTDSVVFTTIVGGDVGFLADMNRKGQIVGANLVAIEV